jgi:hypothetical protein
MKRYFAVALLAAIVLALMVWPIAARVARPFMGFAQSPAKAADGFDRLKVLVGDWEATGEDGKPFTSNIRMVSNNTVLQETFEKKNHDDQMVTMYSADGSRIALTHFCSMGNQPRMETPAVNGASDEFVFSFTGGSNLPTPDSAHMHRLVLQIDDADHFSETWTFREKKGDTKQTFNFVRKK